MLDHAVHHQWSEFRLSDDETGINAPRIDIMQSVMKNPHCWYAIIYAGATHNAYQRGGYESTKENLHLRLMYKTKAIGSVLDDVKQNGDNISEEALLSMVVLASHGSGDRLKGTKTYRRQQLPFLTHIHDVEYYASMETGWEHLQAVYTLLDKRGGLHTIQLKSLAICIQM